jgi:hypothetical protein
MRSHNSSGKYEHVDVAAAIFVLFRFLRFFAAAAAIFVLFRFLEYFTAAAASAGNFLFVFETFDLYDAAPATIIFKHGEKNTMLLCVVVDVVGGAEGMELQRKNN